MKLDFSNLSEKERNEILKEYHKISQRGQLKMQVLTVALTTVVSFVIMRMLEGR